ncbi:polysaccharide deacetylase family protein [Uliginosibacterium sp. H3]|uniref:Polysaccharide deacetylase family protein n=1 Tax=Uliginosibacterium silvisoli TaxID=3114758 RepID=A0ABU6K736_9RHOO|nr:polysaccharide deacetylase family protein [Uliginosibacterium sp. H3]
MEHIYYCFPGGRHKALTFSYDDGKTPDRRLVDILNRAGLKGTFNLNGDKFGRDQRIAQSEVAALYAGHEVAAHSLTHPTLTRCPREMMVRQIVDDRRRLEDIVGYAVRGFAYPNGQHTPTLHRLLPELGIAYARTTISTCGLLLPDELMTWHPTCHHREDLISRAASFLERSKSQYLDLLSVWGHSIDFDNEGNWHIIEELAAMTRGNQDVWFATNIEIVDYLAAVERLQYTAACDRVHNPSAAPVWIRIDSRASSTPQRIVEVPGGATLTLA